jgi:predicted ATPase
VLSIRSMPTPTAQVRVRHVPSRLSRRRGSVPDNGVTKEYWLLVALTVKNFKSIREAHLRFGPLTCVIGHNGVGKSNLFDAIHFLSLLAEGDIYQATVDVRRTSDGSYSPLDLILGRNSDLAIELSADMIVPRLVVDDFGQEVPPATTLLTYSVTLEYARQSDRLIVANEQLTHAKLSDFRQFVGFDTSTTFRNSVAVGSRRGGPLISTDKVQGAIMLHGDGGSRGRPAPVGRSPRTVVGGTNTFDYPTVLAAKREMASWRTLHLEPSAMRTPDSRSAVPHVSAFGGHLAATLNAITHGRPNVQAEVVNRLRELNSDVSDLSVYADDARDQIALRAKVPGVGSWLYARSLSDGTLRYIALALMLADAQERSVLCIEEPENGIHPSRVPNLVRLLYDYAVDVQEAIDEDNPLRQIVLNTHSPEVARGISIEDLVFAERATEGDGTLTSVFRPVAGAWRTHAQHPDDVSPSPPKDRRAVADFIGGSPLSESMAAQLRLPLEFGSAR